MKICRSRFIITVAGTLLFAIIFSSCRQPNVPEVTTKRNSGGPGKTAVKLHSPVFQDGGLIPSRYTCDGANVSPPLQWSDVPPNTKSIAIIVDDPDAPGKTWVHWVLYDLPASQNQVGESVKLNPSDTSAGKVGVNDFGQLAYGGPCPPQGTHRYFFKIYALEVETALKNGSTKDEVERAMQGHILGQGELMAKYQRTR